MRCHERTLPKPEYQPKTCTNRMSRREVMRLQVHNPCDDGTEVGVFASPQFSGRRSSSTPNAPAPCKKRARLPDPGEVSANRGDVLVPTQEILEQQVSALRREVAELRALLHTTFRSALTEITHHSKAPPSPGPLHP
jgi:hypothetical protein